MTKSITARLGLTRWSDDADEFERADFDANMAALEAGAAMYSSGTLGTRPAPGKPGRLYLVTNAVAGAANLFWDTGTSWVDLRPALANYVTRNAVGLSAEVDLMATSNISLSGSQTVDGILTANGGYRVIAANQSDPATNGIYVTNLSGPWTPAFDSVAHRLFFVGNGNVNKNAAVVQSTVGLEGGGQAYVYSRLNQTYLTTNVP